MRAQDGVRQGESENGAGGIAGRPLFRNRRYELLRRRIGAQYQLGPFGGAAADNGDTSPGRAPRKVLEQAKGYWGLKHSSYA